MNVQPQQQPPIAQAIPAQAPLAQWETEADALGLQGGHRQLYKILRGHHNFNQQQCVKLRAEGYSSLSDLVNWRYKNIRSLLENLSNRPSTRGGQYFGDKRIKELQALSWFVTDRSRRGLSFDMDLYQQESDQYIYFAEIDSEIEKDAAADKPEKFKYSNWNKWEESVYIYLNSVITKNGVPLSYVIRKDLDEDVEWETLDRKVQQTHTEGFMFNIDSEKVLTLLKELCLNTEAETWFRNIKCGRKAMKALQRHYDGVDES